MLQRLLREKLEEDGDYRAVVAFRKRKGRIDRLNRESVRFLHTEEAKERFLGIGAEAVGSSPEELAAKVKSEMARMGKVIRDAGIRAE